MNLRKDHYHTLWIHTILHPLPDVRSGGDLQLKNMFCSFLHQNTLFIIEHKPILQHTKSTSWQHTSITKKHYNLQRRISWLSQRWRTQRNAIRNANCRLSESSKFWTQVALPGFPGSMLVSVSVTLTHIIGMWIMTVFFLFFNGNQLKWSRCFIMSFHIWHTC